LPPLRAFFFTCHPHPCVQSVRKPKRRGKSSSATAAAVASRWEPSHSCGGRSASALRKRPANQKCALALGCTKLPHISGINHPLQFRIKTLPHAHSPEGPPFIYNRTHDCPVN